MRNLFLIKININRAGIFPLKFNLRMHFALANIGSVSRDVPNVHQTFFSFLFYEIRPENYPLDYCYNPVSIQSRATVGTPSKRHLADSDPILRAYWVINQYLHGFQVNNVQTLSGSVLCEDISVMDLLSKSCVCFIFRCPSTDAMALAKEQSVTATQITLELILFKFLGSPKLEIFCNLNGCETADDTRCQAVSVIFNPFVYQ